MAEEQVKPEAAADEVEQAEAEEAGEAEAAEVEAEPTREQELEAEVAALREQLSAAVARYRTMVLATAPEVPDELVKGDSVADVDTTFAAAREVVERVRRQLEEQLESQRVPAGAPARMPPDVSGLSAAEKIAYALAQQV